MLQIAINNEDILECLSDTTNSLIIQEYYEINDLANFSLEWYGNPVRFLTEKEIEKQNLEEYLIIDDITIGLKSATIDFQFNSCFPTGSLDFFNKRNGQWEHLQIG